MSALPHGKKSPGSGRTDLSRWHDRLTFPLLTGLVVSVLLLGAQRASNSPTPLNGWCSSASREALIDAEQSLLQGEPRAAYGLAEEVLVVEPACALAHELQAETHYVAAQSQTAGTGRPTATEALACFRSAANAARSNPNGGPRLRALLKICSARAQTAAD